MFPEDGAEGLPVASLTIGGALLQLPKSSSALILDGSAGTAGTPMPDRSPPSEATVLLAQPRLAVGGLARVGAMAGGAGFASVLLQASLEDHGSAVDQPEVTSVGGPRLLLAFCGLVEDAEFEAERLKTELRVWSEEEAGCFGGNCAVVGDEKSNNPLISALDWVVGLVCRVGVTEGAGFPPEPASPILAVARPALVLVKSILGPESKSP